MQHFNSDGVPIVSMLGGGGGGGGGSVNFSAGATSNNLASVVFSNLNGISFGLNGSTITGSHNAITSQSNQNITAGNGGFAFETLSFSNLNGISFSTSAGSAIVASHNGLTSQSNQNAVGSNGNFNFQTISFSNANGISFGTSAGSAIFASHNGITSQSNQQMTLFATSNTTQGTSGTSNASSLIFAGAGIASVGITNGSVVISVPSGGGAGDGGVFAGVSNLGNTLGSTGTVSTGNFVLVGSNGITLSQSTGAVGSNATVTISADGYTASSYDIYDQYGKSSANSGGMLSGTSAIVSLWPFELRNNVSVGCLQWVGSFGFTTVGTSSGRQTAGMFVGIYTRNGSTLNSLWTQSVSYQVTGNNSTYSINQVTVTSFSGYGATAQTSSAGVNITSGYTGLKHIHFPMSSLLTPGQYWFASIGTNSTSSINVGLLLTAIGFRIEPNVTMGAPMGSNTSQFSTGLNFFGGPFIQGQGIWSSAGSVTGLPVSMNFASITGTPGVGHTVLPIIRLWST
jgi:hypothetical protein